jgi:hypothetical protein
MPAPATPIDQLTPGQRDVLADIARVSTEINTVQGTLDGLVAERHELFVRASEAGIAATTIGQVAGVSQAAVSKVLVRRSGGGG